MNEGRLHVVSNQCKNPFSICFNHNNYNWFASMQNVYCNINDCLFKNKYFNNLIGFYIKR